MSVTIRLETGILDDLIRETAGQQIIRYVHDGVHYGFWQEVGVINGFGRGIRIPAHPFMRPAVERVANGFEKAFQDRLTWKQIEAVVEKTAWDIVHIAADLAPYKTGALANSITTSKEHP